MDNRLEEVKKSIDRLVDTVYAAGMDEESTELKNIFDWLIKEVERLKLETDFYQNIAYDLAKDLGTTLEEVVSKIAE